MSAIRTALLASLISGTVMDPSITRAQSQLSAVETLAAEFEGDWDGLRQGIHARGDHLRFPGLGKLDARILAQETIDVVLPLTELLGMVHDRASLEDASFQVLDPDAYNVLVAISGPSDQALLADTIQNAARAFDTAQIEAIVTGRVKSPWSLHRKMARKGIGLDGISDRIGLRVIVANDADCYRAQHLIHAHYEVIPTESSDYIAHPKPSGYRSLHSVVRLTADTLAEFQIRTTAMHAEAEGGAAAHWKYKLNA